MDGYQREGYEPEAILNYLALLGWDYYSALESLNTNTELPTPSSGPGSAILPPHARKDGHSLYEMFTLPQLISAFDITHISKRNVIVSQSRLEFLNKMTLRRKVGRLGADADVIEIGKETLHAGDEKPTAESKREILVRLQAMLREVDELRGV